jgi:hypothetical protein
MLNAKFDEINSNTKEITIKVAEAKKTKQTFNNNNERKINENR